MLYTASSIELQMAELTLEKLAEQLETVTKIATKVEAKLNEKDTKAAAAKKAQDEEKEKEKQEARKAKRAARDAAIKAAMDEEDEDKKDAAIRKAMEDYDEKKGMDEHDPKEHKATDEEKEEKASIASIIKDKKTELITKIMSANQIVNPTGLKAIEERIKSASIADLEKEWSIVEPFVGSTTRPTQTQSQDIPYFASLNPPEHVDSSQLNANSPDSDFNKFTTKELLEMNQ